MPDIINAIAPMLDNWTCLWERRENSTLLEQFTTSSIGLSAGLIHALSIWWLLCLPADSAGLCLPYPAYPLQTPSLTDYLAKCLLTLPCLMDLLWGLSPAVLYHRQMDALEMLNNHLCNNYLAGCVCARKGCDSRMLMRSSSTKKGQH